MVESAHLTLALFLLGWRRGRSFRTGTRRVSLVTSAATKGREDGLVVGMVEEFLDELADGVAGLFAKVFGDLGLLQASLVNQFGQDFDASGRRERDEQAHGIRQIAAAFPVWVNADGNLGIHPRRVGNDEAQFKAVGEDAET